MEEPKIWKYRKRNEKIFLLYLDKTKILSVHEWWTLQKTRKKQQTDKMDLDKWKGGSNQPVMMLIPSSSPFQIYEILLRFTPFYPSRIPFSWESRSMVPSVYYLWLFCLHSICFLWTILLFCSQSLNTMKIFLKCILMSILLTSKQICIFSRQKKKSRYWQLFFFCLALIRRVTTSYSKSVPAGS